MILLNCSLQGDPPVTVDATYPCPWGHTNDGPYLNGDEQECGNGVIDLGEDCDQDPYNMNALIPAETCASLGHGPGTLGCVTTPRACTWDTSGCAAKTCAEYGASNIRLRNVLAPTGDDELVFSARDLPGAAFDPVTEELSFVFRDDQGVIVNAVIPANSPGWTSSGNEKDYTDPAGTFGGVVSVALRATPAFPSRFRAKLRVRSALTAGTNARTGTAVLRVGDECWSDTTPCSSANANVTCKGRAAP